MKIYIPYSITSPREYGGGYPPGWHNIPDAYARQLLKSGQGLDQKAYDIIKRTQATAERANAKTSVEWRKKQVPKAPTKKKKTTPEAPVSGSKYEKSNKVG
jgi:hypothetical protein